MIHCSYVLIIWAVHSWFSCSCKNFSKIPLKGGKIIELFGEVQFCDVNFRYPSRPNQAVLQHFDLTLPPRRIVALCGVSGGGTSFICSFNYGKYKTWKN
ncbi:mitochondrial potassium channel ATP-binding subunit-like isoform X2 [Parasteatoda tepidariorum]|uniref:mitochondrial potassium channel ATP-binding subunit-like isoform X2 n=1 Tax=Parasteatoda tepidariorum TaxID=114398 RepID=UPI0039BC5E98